MQTRSIAEKLFSRLETLDPADTRTFVRRLIDERFFFEEMINILEEGLFVARADHSVAQLNRSAARLLGVERRRKVLGESVEALIGDPALRGAAVEFLNSDRDRARQELIVQYPARRTLSLTAQRMRVSAANDILSPDDGAAPEAREGIEARESGAADELSGTAADSWVAVFVIDDVTEIKQREEDRRRREQTHSLATLTAGVAHEIKNPLNALSIHAQLIERALKSEDYIYNDEARDRVKQSVRIVGEEIERLRTITETFLKSARPVRPQFFPCDVNAMVESALALLRPQMEERGIALEFEPASDLPEARVDAGQMREALLNILSNALDAMEKSDTRRLKVRTFARDNMLGIEIADSGGGIPKTNLAKIFEPYFTTKFDGTGLGLFQVYRVVQMHLGEIQVDSAQGEGTRVVVYLPLKAGPVKLLREDKGEEAGKNARDY